MSSVLKTFTPLHVAFVGLFAIGLTLSSCDDAPKNDIFNDMTPRLDYQVVYEIVPDFKAIANRYDEVWSMQTDIMIKEEILHAVMRPGQRIKRKDIREGFSYNKGLICVIVLAEPHNYTLELLEQTDGHEHLHCKYGAWHQ